MMSAAVHKLYFDSAADEDSSYFVVKKALTIIIMTDVCDRQEE